MNNNEVKNINRIFANIEKEIYSLEKIGCTDADCNKCFFNRLKGISCGELMNFFKKDII